MINLIEGEKGELIDKGSSFLLDSIFNVLRTDNVCLIGVVGGRSIGIILESLISKDIPWDRIHIFFLDERKVPLVSNNSNYKLINDVFLSKLNIPFENIHKFDYEKEDVVSYSKKLLKIKSFFDVVILSAGEDCHVASIFPNTGLNNSGVFYDVVNAPKAPEERISISIDFLKRSRHALLLFIGDSKKEAYEKFKSETSLLNCPAKVIESIENSCVLVGSLRN